MALQKQNFLRVLKLQQSLSIIIVMFLFYRLNHVELSFTQLKIVQEGSNLGYRNFQSSIPYHFPVTLIISVLVIYLIIFLLQLFDKENSQNSNVSMIFVAIATLFGSIAFINLNNIVLTIQFIAWALGLSTPFAGFSRFQMTGVEQFMVIQSSIIAILCFNLVLELIHFFITRHPTKQNRFVIPGKFLQAQLILLTISPIISNFLLTNYYLNPIDQYLNYTSQFIIVLTFYTILYLPALFLCLDIAKYTQTRMISNELMEIFGVIVLITIVVQILFYLGIYKNSISDTLILVLTSILPCFIVIAFIGLISGSKFIDVFLQKNTIMALLIILLIIIAIPTAFIYKNQYTVYSKFENKSEPYLLISVDLIQANNESVTLAYSYHFPDIMPTYQKEDNYYTFDQLIFLNNQYQITNCSTITQIKINDKEYNRPMNDSILVITTMTAFIVTILTSDASLYQTTSYFGLGRQAQNGTCLLDTYPSSFMSNL